MTRRVTDGDKKRSRSQSPTVRPTFRFASSPLSSLFFCTAPCGAAMASCPGGELQQPAQDVADAAVLPPCAADTDAVSVAAQDAEPGEGAVPAGGADAQPVQQPSSSPAAPPRWHPPRLNCHHRTTPLRPVTGCPCCRRSPTRLVAAPRCPRHPGACSPLKTATFRTSPLRPTRLVGRGAVALSAATAARAGGRRLRWCGRSSRTAARVPDASRDASALARPSERWEGEGLAATTTEVKAAARPPRPPRAAPCPQAGASSTCLCAVWGEPVACTCPLARDGGTAQVSGR